MILVIWVFVCYVLFQAMDPEHSYQAQCAATTAVLLFYGANDNNVELYILQRISTIVIGVLLFIVVFMTVAPNSARFSFEERAIEYCAGLTSSTHPPSMVEVRQAAHEPNIGLLKRFNTPVWTRLVNEMEEARVRVSMMRMMGSKGEGGELGKVAREQIRACGESIAGEEQRRLVRFGGSGVKVRETLRPWIECRHVLREMEERVKSVDAEPGEEICVLASVGVVRSLCGIGECLQALALA